MKYFSCFLLLTLLNACTNHSEKDTLVQQASGEKPADVNYLDSLMGKWLCVTKDDSNRFVHHVNYHDYLQVYVALRKEGDAYYLAAYNADQDGDPDSARYQINSCERVYAGSILNVMEYSLKVTETSKGETKEIMFTPLKDDLKDIVRIYGLLEPSSKAAFFEEKQTDKFILDDQTTFDEDM